jgi:hypothetical protein
VLLVAAAAVRGGSGIVETVAGRFEGEIRGDEEQIVVGDREVPFNDVLYMVQDPAMRTIGGSHAVRLTNGERWMAEIVKLESKKLTVRFDLFGAAQVGVERVAALDFTLRGGPATGQAINTLYRETGEPIPGELLWIDEDTIAMDSLLGVLKLARTGAVRYLFRKTVPGATADAAWSAGDEVSLIDGSILRGRLSVNAGGLMLDHTALGTIAIPAPVWRSLARRSDRCRFVTDWAPVSVDAVGLVLDEPPDEPYAYRRGDAARARTRRFFRAITVRPKATLHYQIPEGKGRPVVLRAAAGPAEGCRGDVRLRITAAKGAVFEHEFTPGADPRPVAVDLREGERFAVDVDFGRRIGFPCEAALWDPIVLLKPAGNTSDDTTKTTNGS